MCDQTLKTFDTTASSKDVKAPILCCSAAHTGYGLRGESLSYSVQKSFVEQFLRTV